MKKHTLTIVVLIVFSALFWLLPGYYENSEWFSASALKTRDIFFKIRHFSAPAPEKIKDILIVSIDEESCQELEARWPWPRTFFAEMIRQLDRHGAKVIGLNVSFMGLEESGTASTEELAASIKDHGNTVIGVTFNRENQMVRPNSILAEAVSRYGYLEKIIDSDFVIRRSYLLRPYQKSGEFESSFPLAILAAQSGPQRMHDAKYDPDLDLVTVGTPHLGVYVEPDASYTINYLAAESDFKNISAWRVIKGKFSDADVRGKVVLVGLTSSLFSDRHPTPLGVMAGIDIHANEFLSILAGKTLRFSSTQFMFIFSWILAICVLSFFLMRRFWIGIVGFVIAFGGAFFGAQAAFSKDYVLEPLILLLGPLLGLVAGILSNSLRLLIDNKGLETTIIHDKMTGLYNYDFLRQRLEEEWRRCKKSKTSLSMVMTDLDRFKRINDTLGHETGNEMIKRAGEVIRQSARGYDVVSRYGGDEFFILLSRAGYEEAKAYRERLRNMYHEMAKKLDNPLLQESSISIGVATFDPKVDPKKPASPQELIEIADKDLFEDKESRRRPGEPRR